MKALKQNVHWLQSTSSPTLMVTMKADSRRGSRTFRLMEEEEDV